MSALTERDVNPQPTSNPTTEQSEKKHMAAAGSENRLQDAQHKRVLGQEAAESNEYVEHKFSSKLGELHRYKDALGGDSEC